MTLFDNGVQLAALYELPPFNEHDGIEGYRCFRGVTSCSGAWWAFGSGIVLHSHDGIRWRDLVGELDIVERFSVSSIVGLQDGAFVFARGKSALYCRYFASDARSCERLPSVPSPSPGVRAVRLVRGLSICVEEGDYTRFMRLLDSNRTWEKLPNPLPGNGVHFEMDSLGNGICALWGVERREGHTAPSAVYMTQNSATSWKRGRQMDTMLLSGASHLGRLTILGGTDGFLAEGNLQGFIAYSLNTTDEVAALSSERSQQAVLLASSQEPLKQRLLWRSSSQEWKYFVVALTDRIISIHFISFGRLLLCTRSGLYTCKLEIVQ